MPGIRLRRLAISTSGVAIAGFFALVVLPRSTVPLVDGDVWWHLRAGEEVLRTGSVPAVDNWSIAGEGMQWTSQDWLANSTMAAIVGLSDTWGFTLLSLGFAAVVVVAIALLWLSMGCRRPMPGWLPRLLAMTVGLIVAGSVIGVRVQTLDLLWAVVAVWVLWSYLADQRPRWLLALPPLAVVWVNTHAGFPMLFLLGGSVMVGEAIDRLLGRWVDGVPLTWAANARLAAALLVSCVMLAVNPSGVSIYAYPFETASIGAHRDLIFEWSQPDLSSFPGQVLFGFLLAVVIPTLWFGRRQLRTADALWLIGLTVMSLTAIRFILFLGPIGAAIAAVHLSRLRLLDRLLQGGIWERMTRSPQGPSRRTINAGLVVAIALSGGAIALARSAPPVQRSAIAESMPVGAVAWVRADPSRERIFNVYSWGGYIGRAVPNAVVYIDGRSDIYGDALIREYADAIALESDPAPLLDGARIDTVLFWPDGALADWLDGSGDWLRVHEDARAAVWVRAEEP